MSARRSSAQENTVSTTETAIETAALDIVDANLRLGDGEQTVTALDKVSLTVRPGEMVAVVGPSGSGKSSLLAVAGALTTPDSGTVHVGGRNLLDMKRAEAAKFRRAHIGFVFQSGNLIPSLTAADQLRLVSHLGNSKGRTFRDPIALLEQVGLGHKVDRRPDQLSGGERQRVGIARALVSSPSLLLVDEPTAALDRARSHEIVQLLARETRESRVGTVMVTHDYDVLDYCDRVVEMTDGRLEPR
ncbi:ABC transporter ATP-binding protein [Rhodococcus sp. TAF43]|nr:MULTISPECIES: ABC transporter ATP-binding protein [unclassified Rhodococcus (in: high G+C Gram-positive bacteria)]QKT13828.1 ABC transporter ATP-binding protein [Rhodococcus sp. W8901]RDI30559.1 putative ABC transport system ATP-binding protein [Rhodococcus sp. AG1013]